MHGFTVRFGPVVMRVDGEDPFRSVLDALQSWLTTDEGAGLSVPDVHITLRAASATRSSATAWRSDATLGWWDGKAWDATLTSGASGSLHWELALHEGALVRAVRWSPNWAVRLAHVHYFGYDEILASAVLYGHLLAAAQIALGARGATLVHASSLARPNGESVLILGWGGSGKTSASSQLYMRQPTRWRYMSDDLAIVARDGSVHRSPVPMNVFPYNTGLFPELEGLILDDLDVLSRWQWKARASWLGSSHVARRRAPFTRFLGPDRGILRDVIALERAEVADAVVSASGASQLASEARVVLAHELRRGFAGIDAALNLPGVGAPVAAPASILQAAEETLAAAFDGVRTQRIVLPTAAPPNSVGRVVAAALD